MKTKRMRFCSLVLCLVLLIGVLPVSALAASTSVEFDGYTVYDDDTYIIDTATGKVYDDYDDTKITTITDCLNSAGTKLYLSTLESYFECAYSGYDCYVYFYSKSSRSTSSEISGTITIANYSAIYCTIEVYSGSTYLTEYELTFEFDAVDEEYSMDVEIGEENELDADDFYGSSKWDDDYDILISEPRYGGIYDYSKDNELDYGYDYIYLDDLDDYYYYISSSAAGSRTYDYASFVIYDGSTKLITGTMYFYFEDDDEDDAYYMVVDYKDENYLDTDDFYSGSNSYYILFDEPDYGDIYDSDDDDYAIDYDSRIKLSYLDDYYYYCSSSTAYSRGYASVDFTIYSSNSTSTKTAAGTMYFYFGQDTVSSFTVSYSGSTSYTFSKSDFTDNFTAHSSSGSLAYVKIVSLPTYGTLYLGSTKVSAGDVIAASSLSTLKYTPSSSVSSDYFTYAATSMTSSGLYSETAKITVSGSYTPSDYTATTSGATVTVTFSSSSASTLSQTLSADDVTYLVSQVYTNGSTLVVYMPTTSSSISSRTLSIDSSLFTSSTNRSAFTRVILADVSSSGNTVYLTVPTAGVNALYNTYSGTFSMELSAASLTDEDKSAAAASVGMAREVEMTIGSSLVSPDGAQLSIPYNTTNDNYTSVIMVRTGYQSYEPVLSSTWSDYMPYLTSDARPYVTCEVESNKIYISTVNSTSYSDMASTHWGYNYIRFLSARGVMSGYTGTYEGMVRPDTSVTRAEFIKMLVVALDLYDSTANTSYTDVSGNASWAASYIGSAEAAGIVQDSGSSFRPTEAITREEMALYAYRAASAAGITLLTTTAAVTFNDADQISTTAMATAITAMQQAGIIEGEATGGVATGNFDPQGVTTRAAAAKIISMLMELAY